MQASGVAKWCFTCPHCNTWGSTLPVRINDSAIDKLDESSREIGLEPLRQQNNVRILELLSQFGLAEGSSLLDVGCAHAWFVKEADKRGLRAVGIEPDAVIQQVARNRGLDIRGGLFPDTLCEEDIFDAITFNDVLEHLPDVAGALSSAHRHLRTGGLLSLNIPTSSGVVFRTATAAARHDRLRTIHERLWQVGLPSPHLWYFNEMNLTQLCESRGFDLLYAGRLPSISVRGLWSRVHFDRPVSPGSIASMAAGYLTAPLLNRPAMSDIMLLVFRARSQINRLIGPRISSQFP